MTASSGMDEDTMMNTAMFDEIRFRLAGDRGLLAEFGEGIDPEVNRKVRSMGMALERERPDGIVEIIPTYRSLLIVYDPSTVKPDRLRDAVTGLEHRLDDIEIPPPAEVTLPVCYGGDFGPDIGFVAETHGLTEDEVIRIHTETAYQIYMIGFTPGFCFLGGLAEQLHTPRLETPRTKVPEGSVGIANAQTGVYPLKSPGGWRLIGRTPARLFAPEKENPLRYRAGDLIRFTPIDKNEYERLYAERGA